MKHAGATLVVLAMVAMTLSLSGLALAANDTLLPGEVLTKQFTLSSEDWITYSWTSSAPLAFVIRDPNGVAQVTSTSSSDGGIYTADMDGTFTLTWTNNQASSVSITYDANRFPFGGDGGFFDDMLTVMLIVAAIIIIVVVVIIVLVVFVVGKKEKPAAQQQYPPPMQYGPPGAPLTNCPRCGAPLDPNAAFCQRCGTRVK